MGKLGEVSQNSLITFPVINEEANHPFSQNVDNHCLHWLNRPHETILELPISCFNCKDVCFNTFWHGHLTILTHPDMPYTILCFSIKREFGRNTRLGDNMESRH